MILDHVATSAVCEWGAMEESLSPHQARLIRFKNMLNTSPSQKDIQKLCFDGIPDEGGLRAIYWRVLLGYLPPDTERWSETLDRQRALYYQLADEFVIAEPPAESSVSDHVRLFSFSFCLCCPFSSRLRQRDSCRTAAVRHE